MRTDRPTNDRTDGARTANAVSRRAFVLGAGTCAGAVVGGTASAGDGTTGARRIDVAATGPYRRWASLAVDAFDRENDGSDVRLRTAGVAALDRFRDGDADVLVSGRPVFPDGGVARAVTVAGWGSLAAGGWREPLQRRAVRDRWAADAPVETWSESDEASVAAVAGGSDSSTGAGWHAGTPDAGWTTLVRGTRSDQYSRGHGGVAYSDVDRAEVDVESAGAVPLVRLAYVHADRPDGTAFLAAADSVDGVTSFADPAVADERR